MKKYILLLTLSLILICCSCQPAAEKTSNTMDAVSCHSMSFGDKTIQNIWVILYQEEAPNFESCANEIIQHCINNDFHTIHFSTDVHGYPVEINATVYLDRDDFKNGDSLFSMSYTQPNEANFEYDIVNNPEMFSLTIKESK